MAPLMCGCGNDEGVDLPSCFSNCLYEWIVFGGLFVVGGVGNYVVAVGEFSELYDVWWEWH